MRVLETLRCQGRVPEVHTRFLEHTFWILCGTWYSVPFFVTMCAQHATIGPTACRLLLSLTRRFDFFFCTFSRDCTYIDSFFTRKPTSRFPT